jgi:hypothetical protein
MIIRDYYLYYFKTLQLRQRENRTAPFLVGVNESTTYIPTYHQ